MQSEEVGKPSQNHENPPSQQPLATKHILRPPCRLLWQLQRHMLWQTKPSGRAAKPNTKRLSLVGPAKTSISPFEQHLAEMINCIVKTLFAFCMLPAITNSRTQARKETWFLTFILSIISPSLCSRTCLASSKQRLLQCFRWAAESQSICCLPLLLRSSGRSGLTWCKDDHQRTKASRASS